MVSRRTSVALMVSLLLAALLLRGLLGVERPGRDSEHSCTAGAPAPEAKMAEPLRDAAQPSIPEMPGERQAFPTDALPRPPLEALTMDRPLALETNSVFVSVLDAYGRPAPGLPVGLSIQLDEPDTPVTDSASVWEGRRALPADSGVTDATGSVELDYSTPTGLELPYFRTRIAPQLAFKELPTSETGPGELPAPVVILRLPATGTIRVRVMPMEPAARGATFVEALIDGQIRREERVTEGAASFSFVELGCDIELRLTTAAMANRPAKVLVRGPEVPDEVVEAELVLDAWPTLLFRVCDEAGQPLANAAFPVRIHHGRLSPQTGNARTDENGAVEFVVYGDARNEDARELLLWSLSPPRLARVWLPDVLTTPTELGNITFRRVAPDSVPPP